MKKQIYIAIALPLLLASATSTLAGEVVKKPALIPSVTVKPIVSVPVTASVENTHRNGEGTVTKKPVKPPSPPRKEISLVNQR